MNMPCFRRPGLLACAATMLLGACSSARTHYHSLTPVRQASGEIGTIACTFDPADPGPAQPHLTSTVLLAHLTVPAEADRMQLLLHQSPTRLSVYETERWAAPLEDQISSILIENLRNARPDLSIIRDPLLIGAKAHLQLRMDIEQLDALAGKDVTVRAQWRLSIKDDDASRTGTCTARQPLRSADIDETVLAWSRALGDISSALAAAIQPRADSR
jgi:uncharacterized lipoprotein YmbA